MLIRIGPAVQPNAPGKLHRGRAALSNPSPRSIPDHIGPSRLMYIKILSFQLIKVELGQNNLPPHMKEQPAIPQQED
jgi:hypothetical protein